jgi:L-ascorbate metabolism protein UlaG (beta-lactamase superfamily)
MATVTYLGHSCFEIQHDGVRLVIDPYLTGNPNSQVTPEEVKVQYVLVTHGHGDHWGDTEAIAKANDATVITCKELAEYAQTLGLKVHPMHIGGGFNFSFGRVQMTAAPHGTGAGESGQRYSGVAAGFLIKLGGATIYHAGDTALTYDMKLLDDLHDVDLALLPIGDNFTMGIDDAVVATRFVNPKTVVPMHYDTFDLIKADPREFARKVEDQTSARPVVMGIGDSMEL